MKSTWTKQNWQGRRSRHFNDTRHRNIRVGQFCQSTLFCRSGKIPVGAHGCYIINKQLHKAITAIVQRDACAAVFTHLKPDDVMVSYSSERRPEICHRYTVAAPLLQLKDWNPPPKQVCTCTCSYGSLKNTLGQGYFQEYVLSLIFKKNVRLVVRFEIHVHVRTCSWYIKIG